MWTEKITSVTTVLLVHKNVNSEIDLTCQSNKDGDVLYCFTNCAPSVTYLNKTGFLYFLYIKVVTTSVLIVKCRDTHVINVLTEIFERCCKETTGFREFIS